MPPPPKPLTTNVCMRGFVARATVDSALAWLDAFLPKLDALPSECVPLEQAFGRVLRSDIISPADVPSFARSMMDGFALRAADTYGASTYNRLPLRIVGTSLPGRPFEGALAIGEAVRIMTGAPLPEGADAVLPAEFVEWNEEELLALDQVSPGKHVSHLGEDVQAGDRVAPAGRRLRPQDLGLLSSIGCSALEVVRTPTVRIIITGSEVLPAGTKPDGCRVADANGPMLAALVTRDGGAPLPPDLIPDDPSQIRAALQQPADIVVVSGGSSVGQEDFVPQIVSELGELAIHGIAMRPSSPTGMGRVQGRLVFLLPGNPVSCLCAYDFFAGLAIRALAGRSRDWPYPKRRVRLTRKLVSTVGRLDYARITVAGDTAEPLAISGASILSSTTRADGFVIVPADSEGYPAGAEVEVFLYQSE